MSTDYAPVPVTDPLTSFSDYIASSEIQTLARMNGREAYLTADLRATSLWDLFCARVRSLFPGGQSVQEQYGLNRVVGQLEAVFNGEKLLEFGPDHFAMGQQEKEAANQTLSSAAENLRHIANRKRGTNHELSARLVGIAQRIEAMIHASTALTRTFVDDTNNVDKGFTVIADPVNSSTSSGSDHEFVFVSEVHEEEVDDEDVPVPTSPMSTGSFSSRTPLTRAESYPELPGTPMSTEDDLDSFEMISGESSIETDHGFTLIKDPSAQSPLVHLTPQVETLKVATPTPVEYDRILGHVTAVGSSEEELRAAQETTAEIQMHLSLVASEVYLAAEGNLSTPTESNQRVCFGFVNDKTYNDRSLLAGRKVFPVTRRILRDQLIKQLERRRNSEVKRIGNARTRTLTQVAFAKQLVNYFDAVIAYVQTLEV